MLDGNCCCCCCSCLFFVKDAHCFVAASFLCFHFLSLCVCVFVCERDWKLSFWRLPKSAWTIETNVPAHRKSYRGTNLGNKKTWLDTRLYRRINNNVPRQYSQTRRRRKKIGLGVKTYNGILFLKYIKSKGKCLPASWWKGQEFNGKKKKSRCISICVQRKCERAEWYCLDE